jgi:hypothetical protein
VTVEILCSEPELAFRGQWRGDGGPDALLRRLIGEAERRGIPIQLTISGHGTWSIAPNGRVIRGALFLEKKLPKTRSRAWFTDSGCSSVPPNSEPGTVHRQ